MLCGGIAKWSRLEETELVNWRVVEDGVLRLPKPLLGLGDEKVGDGYCGGATGLLGVW